jgi:hypothetical protein
LHEPFVNLEEPFVGKRLPANLRMGDADPSSEGDKKPRPKGNIKTFFQHEMVVAMGPNRMPVNWPSGKPFSPAGASWVRHHTYEDAFGLKYDDPSLHGGAAYFYDGVFDASTGRWHSTGYEGNARTANSSNVKRFFLGGRKTEAAGRRPGGGEVSSGRDHEGRH